MGDSASGPKKPGQNRDAKYFIYEVSALQDVINLSNYLFYICLLYTSDAADE